MTPASIRYLLVLDDLCREGRGVRSVEIAARMNVSKPSAHSMLQNLCQAGLVEKERYGTVFLTPEGRRGIRRVLRPPVPPDAAGPGPGGGRLSDGGLRHPGPVPGPAAPAPGPPAVGGAIAPQEKQPISSRRYNAMIETIVQVDGMMCGMCESHINDAIRSHFQVKKVSSSHTKGQTVIQSQEPLDREQLVRVINDTGYQAGEVVSRPLEKRGLLGRLKK